MADQTETMSISWHGHLKVFQVTAISIPVDYISARYWQEFHGTQPANSFRKTHRRHVKIRHTEHVWHILPYSCCWLCHTGVAVGAILAALWSVLNERSNGTRYKYHIGLSTVSFLPAVINFNQRTRFAVRSVYNSSQGEWISATRRCGPLKCWTRLISYVVFSCKYSPLRLESVTTCLYSSKKWSRSSLV